MRHGVSVVGIYSGKRRRKKCREDKTEGQDMTTSKTV